MKRNRWVAGPLLAAAIAALAALQACSLFKPKPEPTAEENYRKGMEKFEARKYQDAIPYFQKIIENYPFSKYALDAELKIAESYFLDKKYMEALVHLQGFEELHPTNENLPYVIWMKGVSYFEQSSTIDRDISSLENAEREFLKLQSRFPDNPYRQKGDPVLREVRARLARHDYYVAKFYYRAAQYRPAIARLERIMTDYPDVEFKDRVLYCLGKSYFFLKENERAKEAFESLLAEYPQSRYSSKAREFLEDLEKGRFTIVSRYFRLKERVFGWFGYE